MEQYRHSLEEKPLDPQYTAFQLGISVLLLISFLLIVGGTMAVVLSVDSPLAEPLRVVAGARTQRVLAISPAATAASTPSAVPLSAGGPAAAFCGNSGGRLLLVTGIDDTQGVEPRGADAIRLVKVDYEHGKMIVVAFPRDLLVQTPGLSSLQIRETRLGLAYHIQKESSQGDDRRRSIAATTLLAQTIYDNFGAAADGYFTLQLDQAAAMVDTIGGVTVHLPSTIVSDSRLTFLAGTQTLNGALSAEFVRTFEPGGEAARMARQNLYLRALQRKMVSDGLLPQLPRLIEQFEQAVVTDQSPKNLLDLACLALSVPAEQVLFYEIGSSLVTPGNGGALNPDSPTIREHLRVWLEK